MKVLIIGGNLAATRWSHSGLIRQLCRGLAGRGHDVTLACMSADDPAWFAPARLISMAPYDHSASDWPAGFARWTRVVVAAARADVVISTSRLAWGDVWLPLGPSASAWIQQVTGALGPVGLGKWVYKHTGVLAARAVEARRPWPRGIGSARPSRVAVFGTEAAANAREALAAHRLDTRVVALPFVASCEPPDDLARERDRIELRRAAGARATDTFGLVSSVELVGEALGPMLQAIAQVNARLGRTGREGKFILGVLARDAFHAHDAAVRAGAADAVRVLGTTDRIVSVLGACDVAIVPPAAIPDAFVTGSAGRFAADALRLARPVLAADGAPGAELLASLPGLGPAGAVVRHDGVEPASAPWERAIARAMEPQWQDRAMVAAAAAGAPERIGSAQFFDALEDAIDTAIGERNRSASRRAERLLVTRRR